MAGILFVRNGFSKPFQPLSVSEVFPRLSMLDFSGFL